MDVDVLRGRHDGRRDALHDGLPVGVGAAGDDLDEVGGKLPGGGEVLLGGNQLAFHEMPVEQELHLQPVDGRPLDAHHGVAPLAEVIALEIAVGHVDPAGEAHPPVHHHDFAVVAVVYLAAPHPQAQRQEGVDVHARLLEAADVAGRHGQAEAAPIVVYHAHPHPGAGLADEQFAQAVGYFVVGEDEELDVDVVACALDGIEEGTEGGRAVGKDVYLIEGVARRPAVAVQQVDEVELVVVHVARVEAAQVERSHGAVDEVLYRVFVHRRCVLHFYFKVLYMAA